MSLKRSRMFPLLTAALAFACESEPGLGPGQTLSIDATVQRFTSVESSCWALATSSRQYEPVDLPAEFRVDGRAVHVVLRDAPPPMLSDGHLRCPVRPPNSRPVPRWAAGWSRQRRAAAACRHVPWCAWLLGLSRAPPPAISWSPSRRRSYRTVESRSMLRRDAPAHVSRSASLWWALCGRGSWHHAGVGAAMRPPNLRLKLPGDDRFIRKALCRALTGTGRSSTSLAPAGGSPAA